MSLAYRRSLGENQTNYLFFYATVVCNNRALKLRTFTHLPLKIRLDLKGRLIWKLIILSLLFIKGILNFHLYEYAIFILKFLNIYSIIYLLEVNSQTKYEFEYSLRHYKLIRACKTKINMKKFKGFFVIRLEDFFVQYYLKTSIS